MSRERLCPFAERYPQPPQPLSAPFGPGVSALFRLLNPDDSYNDSHYILHGTLILAVRLSQALSLSTLSREFPTRALPPTQVTVGLPQMDRVAVYSNLLRDFVSQVEDDAGERLVGDGHCGGLPVCHSEIVGCGIQLVPRLGLGFQCVVIPGVQLDVYPAVTAGGLPT